MFNIGFSELLILAVIGLLVVGPEQLPDLARKVSRLLNDLKRAKDDIMAPIDEMKSEAHLALMKMRQEIEEQNTKINQSIKKIEDDTINKQQSGANKDDIKKV